MTKTVTARKSEQAAVSEHSSKTMTQDAERSPESIMRTVIKEMGGLRTIYNGYLENDPDLNGKIVVNFTIEAPGEVSEITVKESTIGNQDFDKEVCSEIKTWRFEKIEGSESQTITYPFVFSK